MGLDLMGSAAWAPRVPVSGMRARVRGTPLPGAWRVVLPVAVLTVVALGLRWRALATPLWIDEGISMGIASHPLAAIPGLLRLDGSPPLYYLLLHVWMTAFGTTVVSAHALSVLVAVLGVPAAGWATARPFGPRAAVLASALAAFDPFLSLYADEVRMYSLTFLLGVLATGAFVRAYVLGSRRWAVGFGVLIAVTCLTHNWGFFLALSAVPAFALALWARREQRRAVLIDGALGAVVAAAIVAPWVPTLLFQTAHTGAPWSSVPHLGSLTHAAQTMLGGASSYLALLIVGAGGLAAVLRSGSPAARLGLVCAVGLAGGTLLGGFLLARFGEPAWAPRYLTIVLGPLVVALGAGLARAGYGGLIAAPVVCLLVWLGHPSASDLRDKSNVDQLVATLGHELPRGSLVVSPQPEEVPVTRFYLGEGFRYVTPLGLQRDAGVTDWRDALARLRAATVQRDLAPSVAALAPGQRVLLVWPRLGHPQAAWTRGIQRQAQTWRTWLTHEANLRVLARYTPTQHFARATVSGILLEVPRRAAPGPLRSSRRALDLRELPAAPTRRGPRAPALGPGRRPAAAHGGGRPSPRGRPGRS